MKKALKAAARGAIFPYAGEKWVALEHEASGRTLCLRLDLIPNKPFDENNCNNFATSSSKEWMNGPYLDNLIDAVKGPHAFLTTELDLTADDGLKDYGTCTVTIFSLTVDQYRRNRNVIPNADDWWWLSTAYSTAANGYEHSARGVSSVGTLIWDSAYNGDDGLRPACYLDSDLLISVEDGDEDTGVGPQEAGTIVAELVEQFGGTYATGEQFAAEVSFLLGKLRAIREKEAAHEYTDSITYGWTSVQYRVKAYDSAGAESAYTTSAVRTVTNNRPPVISGSDTDLGSFTTTPPSYEYTVTDADGHQVTVVEKLDATTLRTYTATLGGTNELEITADQWLKLLNGDHTLTITATDAKNESAVRTLSFDKAMHSVEFEQTVAMAADDMPTKALVNIQGSFPTGSTLQVWICNNGNDAEPTWEDITTKALTSQKHFFTNQTKTAASWGVKIKVKLLRGSAEGDCYIQSVGGNFA